MQEISYIVGCPALDFDWGKTGDFLSRTTVHPPHPTQVFGYWCPRPVPAACKWVTLDQGAGKQEAEKGLGELKHNSSSFGCCF